MHVTAQEKAEPTGSSNSRAKLRAFYEKLAEHERLAGSLDESRPVEAEGVCNFNPEEQDEENYSYHNENKQYFENTAAEEVILFDLG